MSQRLLLAWALSATALALIFLGYAIGRTMGTNDRAPAPAGYAAYAPDTSGGEPPVQPADPNPVPEALVGLPTEWRSEFSGEDFRGYAILLDTQRREIIVEQCLHPGYVDERTGALVEPMWEFCQGVLWGTLTKFEDLTATVVDRDSGPVDVEFNLADGETPPRLSLSFNDRSMELIPGSKNDLLQAMENAPAMVEQKDKFLKTTIAKEDAARRMAEEAGGDRPTREVPVYTLPERADPPEKRD